MKHPASWWFATLFAVAVFVVFFGLAFYLFYFQDL